MLNKQENVEWYHDELYANKQLWSDADSIFWKKSKPCEVFGIFGSQNIRSNYYIHRWNDLNDLIDLESCWFRCQSVNSQRGSEKMALEFADDSYWYVKIGNFRMLVFFRDRIAKYKDELNV